MQESEVRAKLRAWIVKHTKAAPAKASAFTDETRILEEGILSSLESSHAVAEAVRLAPTLPSSKIIIVNISGRAEKDLFILARAVKDKEFRTFVERYSDSWNEKQ